VADGVIEAEIVGVDHFGNVQLAAGPDALAGFGMSATVEFGQERFAVTVGRTFGDVPVGGLLLHVDSSGAVEIAVNSGSAAAVLGGESGMPGMPGMVVVRRG
jgi:S-adenosylmethionine hydrolase